MGTNLESKQLYKSILRYFLVVNNILLENKNNMNEYLKHTEVKQI